jgi:hypothetical protein
VTLTGARVAAVMMIAERAVTSAWALVRAQAWEGPTPTVGW